MSDTAWTCITIMVIALGFSTCTAVTEVARWEYNTAALEEGGE